MKPATTPGATLALTLSLLAGPTLAGPDWATIEQGRATVQTQQGATESGARAGAPPTKLVLQNYGPRPQFVRRPVSNTPPIAKAEARR
jgi:hypothetical protein